MSRLSKLLMEDWSERTALQNVTNIAAVGNRKIRISREGQVKGMRRKRIEKTETRKKVKERNDAAMQELKNRINIMRSLQTNFAACVENGKRGFDPKKRNVYCFTSKRNRKPNHKQLAELISWLSKSLGFI
ncbi:unnamed protein product [Oikopleura dioica]|uniref:Uncharacterized protein n=1 Tax=Oikopleura dioica TaxID=34765 RepID=E4XH90_OIKDI|nr:unnamed protein product [Oikopleura dioica]